MRIRALHRWDVDGREAGRIQRELRGRLLFEPPEGEPRLVAGADVSWSAADKRILVAAVVLMDLPGLTVVEEVVARRPESFPYVPGYLSFREAPVLLDAFARLRGRPDLVLFDGQGIAHPRGFGLAAHVGLILDLPSVGCAKSRLVGEHDEVGRTAGSRTPLRVEGCVVGSVLRTRTGVKPVYVSPGHRIDVDGAVDATMRCLSRYRLPEPIRRAHRLTREARRAPFPAMSGAGAAREDGKA
jgi:deoxyribonuclease V